MTSIDNRQIDKDRLIDQQMDRWIDTDRQKLNMYQAPCSVRHSVLKTLDFLTHSIFTTIL